MNSIDGAGGYCVSSFLSFFSSQTTRCLYEHVFYKIQCTDAILHHFPLAKCIEMPPSPLYFLEANYICPPIKIPGSTGSLPMLDVFIVTIMQYTSNSANFS